MKCWTRVLAIALFAAGALSKVEACTCGSGSGPACQEAWRQGVDAVFLGRVEKIEPSQGVPGMVPGAMSMTMMGGMLKVTIAAEENYRGTSAKTIQVYTASSSAACGYSFREGESYLVYASADDKRGQLLVSICSATKPAEYSAKDLTYLRSVSSLPPTATIMGSAWRYTHDPNFKPKFQPSIMDHYRPPEQDYMAMVPVPGATVTTKATDGTEHDAVVDADGNWQISDLRPGSYTVRPQSNEATFVYPFRANVEIAPRGCAKIDIRVESNGRISGTLDHPAPGTDWALIKVFALPFQNPDLHHPTRETTLEPSESVFEVGPLPPGKYILGAYLVRKISVPPNGHTYADEGAFYFPGRTGLAGADPIDVAEGKAVTNVKLKMMY